MTNQNSNMLVSTIKILLFLSVLIALTSPQLFREIHSNDAWKALYSGRYLSLFGQMPDHSTYTFSPTKKDFFKSSYNWLGNYLLYQLYSIFGYSGLQILRILIAALAFQFAFKQFQYRFNPMVLLLMLIFIWGISFKLRIRTAIFAVVGVCLVLGLVFSSRNYSGDWPLYFIPVVLTIWGNLHGSYLVGIGLLGIFCFGLLLDNLFMKEAGISSHFIKLIVLIFFSTLCASFIKPYPDSLVTDFGYQFLNQSSSVLTQLKDEKVKLNKSDSKRSKQSTNSILDSLRIPLFPEKPFRSNEFNHPLNELKFWYVKFSLLTIPIVIISFLSDFKNPSFALWLTFLTVAFLGMSYIRITPYIPLVGLPIMGVWLNNRGLSNFFNSKSTIFISTSLILILFGFIGFHVYNQSTSKLTNQSHYRIGWGVSETKFSRTVPNYLLDKYPDQHIANHYNIGSFLVWQWWPFKKVFVDTKSSAYANSFWRQISTIGMAGIMDKNQIDIVVQGKVRYPDGRTRIRGSYPYNPGWNKIIEDQAMIAHIRKN